MLNIKFGKGSPDLGEGVAVRIEVSLIGERGSTLESFAYCAGRYRSDAEIGHGRLCYGAAAFELHRVSIVFLSAEIWPVTHSPAG